MKGFSQAIGWIIGAAIIFPLGLYLYQKYVSLNDGYKYIDEYIQHSKQIKLDLNTSFNGGFDEYLQSYTKRSSTTANDRNVYPFYSNIYKKYFAIQEFDAGTNFMVQMHRTKFNDTIVASVNDLEMTDPSYGSKNNPIPVLKIKINVPGDNPGLNVLNISENRYRYNVGEYLTYFKSKSDFKKMFEK